MRTRSIAVGVEQRELVGHARLAAAVPAHERGEQLDLVGREAAQLAVAHEVRAVPVVAAAGDVLADVVQQRGELEQLAVVGVEAVQLGGGVEEVERRASRPDGSAAPASCTGGRGSSTALPRMACGSSDQSAGSWRPHRVEHDALAQRPLADRELVELERVHRGGQHHRPGDDEVDPSGVEAVDAQAVGGLRGDEVLVQREELACGRW